MSLNSVNFDLKESSFTNENNKKDGKGMGRDGSGRAGTYRATGIPHCFTLECNYATGLKINLLKPRLDLVKKVKLAKEENPISDSTSSFYKGKKAPLFNSDVFKDVGQSFLVGILDLEMINPVTRILKSLDEPFDQALDRLRKEIDRELKGPSMMMKNRKASAFKPEFEIIVSTKKTVLEQENL